MQSQEREARYLHPQYYATLNSDEKLSEPCPDVYDFPFLTRRWCREMIEEMEFYGKWSDGTSREQTKQTKKKKTTQKNKQQQKKNKNVPTRDVHYNQIGYERQ